MHPTKFGRKSTNDMNSSYILIIVCCCFSNHSDTCLVVSIVVSYNWNTVLTTKFVEVDSKPCERQKDYWSNLPAGFGFHSFHRPGVPCITSQALTSRPTVYTIVTHHLIRTNDLSCLLWFRYRPPRAVPKTCRPSNTRPASFMGRHCK